MNTFTVRILEPDFKAILRPIEAPHVVMRTIPKFPQRYEFLSTLVMEHCL